MDKLYNIFILVLIGSLALRSLARTYAYICLAQREKQDALKSKLLKK